MNEKNDKASSPTTINRHLNAVIPAFALLAGMQLDIFTPLKDGPMDTEALAKVLGVKADKLSLLLYALVMADLLKVENGIFSNTNEANLFLVRGNPGHMGASADYYNFRWQAVLKSAETIRTGIPQSKIDWSTMNEDVLLGILRSRYPACLASGRQLAKQYDFTGCSHLMDAGGGPGGLAIGLCESSPDLQGTIVELPTVAPISERIVSEMNMSDRIKTIAADLVDTPPAGVYDVAVLRDVIQTLSPKHAKAMLMNVGKALETDGKIYILGQILDDTRLHPAFSVDLNLLFLNIYDDGRAFTESEYRGWLDEAGFIDVATEYEVMPNVSIITARKA